ncbi:methyl-accepting chemotaxis protein [Granulosicoccus sp. 3-233]|uniref:methyl-accepting chemotaxis protein n=1 Tax=Granulosicoccus sp. 3-233 TaxID=3417969 RepID=UPI003D336B0A
MKWAIGGLICLLLILVILKPRVENEFNTRYLNNIADMQALTGQLLRDHLLVRQGLVKHYDYLEADLEMMERTSRLARYVPAYVGQEYRERSSALLDDYTSAVVELRKQVDKSKRGVGLLENARAAFRRYLGELASVTTNHANPVVNGLMNDLVFDVVYQEPDEQWLGKLEQLQGELPVTASVINPLSLHARMIIEQRHQLASSSTRLYEELEELDQPLQLKALFVDQYVGVASFTAALLWASYAIVAALLVLCGILTVGSRKAQEQAQRLTLVAQQAQAGSEKRVQETQIAVSQCNELLSKIAEGDFGSRLQGPFDEELELLRTGINQTADSVEFTMSELTRVMLAIQEGRFDVRLDSRVQGDIGQQVDQTITVLDTTFDTICSVMDDMRDGCFGARVDVQCQGRLDELKQSINSSMSVMEGAIAAVVEVAEYQSQGDFNRQIRTGGKGQIELLANSINATSAKVHEMVQQIRQASSTVATSSDSMQVNSRRLQEHTTVHSDGVSQLLEKVDLVRQSIQTNRDSVQQATRLVDRSRQAADEGSNIASQAIGYMDDINEKSREIASNTQVLDTIAKQTNLLALNAAVEAARAGTHGSGFSVVANEVKELARQSAQASTHITALIAAISNDILQGAESVSNTGQSLQAINQSISNVEQATRIIVDESLLQEREMDTIVDIVEDARRMMVSDSQLAETNMATSVSLGELAHRVSELLAFFKAGDRDLPVGRESAAVASSSEADSSYRKVA